MEPRAATFRLAIEPASTGGSPVPPDGCRPRTCNARGPGNRPRLLAAGRGEKTTDALLIAGAQRVEHYEMAAYGTLVAWAGTLGLAEAAEILEETLEEEKTADAKLTALATSGVNDSANA